MCAEANAHIYLECFKLVFEMGVVEAIRTALSACLRETGRRGNSNER